jgi:hypothetical protein
LYIPGLVLSHYLLLPLLRQLLLHFLLFLRQLRQSLLGRQPLAIQAVRPHVLRHNVPRERLGRNATASAATAAYQWARPLHMRG